MRSKQMSLKLPWRVEEALRQICKEENYENFHSCVIGALIEKVQSHKRRSLVKSIAQANPKLQDYLLDKMFEFPLDAKGAAAVFRKGDG